MVTNNSLIIKNLSKQFKEQTVFKNLSFEVKKKSPLIVCGKNGSGKSTLLQIIAGLKQPTEGEIFLFNNKKKIPLKELEFKISYLSPDLVLFENLTVKENIEIFADLKDLALNPFWKMLKRLHLTSYLDKEINTLSSGNRQKLKIVLAFSWDAEIYLFDEPDCFLDEEALSTLKICLKEKENKIMVIATNNLQLKNLFKGRLNLNENS